MFGMFDNPKKVSPIPPPSTTTQAVTDEAAKRRRAAAMAKGRESTIVASRKDGNSYGQVGTA